MATWSRFTTNPGASRIFKEYLINPLGLVLRNGLLYLVCTFSGYEDIRQLLLHRMRQAEVVNEPCAVPDGFDLDGYIQDQGFDLARGRPDIPLRFRFRAVPASALYETPLSTDQVITPLAEGNGSR